MPPSASGMSGADLRALNSVPPRMLIKAGSTLIVPRGARVKEDVAAVVADSGHLSFQPEIVTRRTTVKAGRNDSVASIARRYKLRALQRGGVERRQAQPRIQARLQRGRVPAGSRRPRRARVGRRCRSARTPRPRRTVKRGGNASKGLPRAAASSKQVVREKRGGHAVEEEALRKRRDGGTTGVTPRESGAGPRITRSGGP